MFGLHVRHGARALRAADEALDGDPRPVARAPSDLEGAHYQLTRGDRRAQAGATAAPADHRRRRRREARCCRSSLGTPTRGARSARPRCTGARSRFCARYCDAEQGATATPSRRACWCRRRSPTTCRPSRRSSRATRCTRGISEEEARSWMLLGSADDVCRQIDAFVAAGVTHFVVDAVALQLRRLRALRRWRCCRATADGRTARAKRLSDPRRCFRGPRLDRRPAMQQLIDAWFERGRDVTRATYRRADPRRLAAGALPLSAAAWQSSTPRCSCATACRRTGGTWTARDASRWRVISSAPATIPGWWSCAAPDARCGQLVERQALRLDLRGLRPARRARGVARRPARDRRAPGPLGGTLDGRHDRLCAADGPGAQKDRQRRHPRLADDERRRPSAPRLRSALSRPAALRAAAYAARHCSRASARRWRRWRRFSSDSIARARMAPGQRRRAVCCAP